MNEYEKCLFEYMMEEKYREILTVREYRLAAEQADRAMDALAATFTPEQEELFDRFYSLDSGRDLLAQEWLFSETLAMVRGLLTAAPRTGPRCCCR